MGKVGGFFFPVLKQINIFCMYAYICPYVLNYFLCIYSRVTELFLVPKVMLIEAVFALG